MDAMNLIVVLLLLALMGMAMLIMRGMFLWFFRINDVIRLLDKIEKNTDVEKNTRNVTSDLVRPGSLPGGQVSETKERLG